jgi:2-dehydropantoate 2-reductase
MRFIVYGAGAIGGLVGGLLAISGEEVVLIARGAHAEAIAERGLTIVSAEQTRSIAVPVVTSPTTTGPTEDDVVLLGMKSHDTAAALDVLTRCAPVTVPVVCLQNGVENERTALRLFRHVYGVCVLCPAVHLDPGVIQQNSVPVPGVLDVGGYPSGTDAVAARVSEAFRKAGFESVQRSEVMRWKYRKLLMNLGNAVQALCHSPGTGEIVKQAQAEGEDCLQAAGIDYASMEEDSERRGNVLQIREIQGRPRGGGSSWQSLQRGTGTIESDYLNGEIGLLGRLHGIPTPVNDTLQRLAGEAAIRRDPPGGLSAEEFWAQLGASPG